MQYLIVPLLAWLIAQSLKHVAGLFGKNRRIFNAKSRSTLMLSGGMPSAHSATVVALTAIIGLNEGWSSAIFALSAVFSSVVIYDAVMVRYSSGQQGDVLNELLKSHKKQIQPIHVAHGHTVLEVFAGAIVGVVVAVVVFFTTQYFQ